MLQEIKISLILIQSLKIMRSLTSRWGHQDYIKIEWNIGKRCNLDCAYCPAEIHDNFSPHTNIKIMLDAVDKLEELAKPVRLSFTGGEPSVHPDIEELLEHCNRSAHIDFISMTTNATRTVKWYLSQPTNQYVFSLHFDNEVSSRMLTNAINVGKEYDRQIFVNLMAHHGYMDQVKRAWEMLRAMNIPTVVRRIRWTKGDADWFDDMRYQPEDLDWILSTESTAKENCVDDEGNLYVANDVIKHHLNQFKGWTCNAGLESLMINWDGDVHRATCRVGGSLGNIYDGSFEVPEEPIICTRNWCTCASDIPITKISD